MKHNISNILIGFGAALILAALVLFSYNQYEAAAADRNAIEVLSKLMVQIDSSQSAYEEHKSAENAEHLPDSYSAAMDTLSVDGHDYIGYLMIPELRMEVPIMAQWSMENLRITPCRYAGSVSGNDLVLMGHNYERGFGRLSNIELGDEVYFGDVNGAATSYKVVAKDILSASSVEEMVSGEYDMTLFTCTYDGQNRLTIRCEKTV